MIEQMDLGIVKRPKLPPVIRLTEHELMNWCISYLSLRGHFVQRINSGRATREYKGQKYWIMLAEKGTPDIIGYHGRNGKYIGIEVKIRPNKPSPAQIEFIERLVQSGGLGAIIYSQEELMNLKGL